MATNKKMGNGGSSHDNKKCKKAVPRAAVVYTWLLKIRKMETGLYLVTETSAVKH